MEKVLCFTLGPVGILGSGAATALPARSLRRFSGTDRPVVECARNIGHTMPPNGEILEANPALPRVPVPLTREKVRRRCRHETG